MGMFPTCPRCGAEYTPYDNDDDFVPNESPSFPALSRRDNKTNICSRCGEHEAFEDMGFETYEGPVYWVAR